MKKVTHALTMNGRGHDEVKDLDLSPRGLIEQRLGLLDGAVRYSLSLWRFPDGVPFDSVDRGHCVVGRNTSEPAVEVVIPWDGHEARVYSSEVFSAAEAAEVLAQFYDTGRVADTYHRRPPSL